MINVAQSCTLSPRIVASRANFTDRGCVRSTSRSTPIFPGATRCGWVFNHSRGPFWLRRQSRCAESQIQFIVGRRHAGTGASAAVSSVVGPNFYTSLTIFHFQRHKSFTGLASSKAKMNIDSTNTYAAAIPTGQFNRRQSRARGLTTHFACAPDFVRRTTSFRSAPSLYQLPHGRGERPDGVN